MAKKKTDEKTGPGARGSKAKVLEFLLKNMGRVIEAKEVQEASGWVAEWGRRLRELRNEEGYQILSHKDRADLKPGEYLLETDERLPAFARSISKETRAVVLERNGFTCQSCGLAPSDPDPFYPGRKVRLTMGHIIDKSKGGADDPGNLRAVCTNCNEGLQNVSKPKPSRIELLSFVRRATVEDQLALLEWLQKKYAKKIPKPQ